MYKIGITGSIGTGKTTIANMFALFNIPVFNADQEIKKILRKKNIKQKLKNIWPLIIKGQIFFNSFLISFFLSIFFISLSASNIGILNRANIFAIVVFPVPIDPVIPILYIINCE